MTTRLKTTGAYLTFFGELTNFCFPGDRFGGLVNSAFYQSIWLVQEGKIAGEKNNYYQTPISILVATPMSSKAKIRFRRSTGKLCASLTPRGAVRTLTAAMPMRAGR